LGGKPTFTGGEPGNPSGVRENGQESGDNASDSHARHPSTLPTICHINPPSEPASDVPPKSVPVLEIARRSVQSRGFPRRQATTPAVLSSPTPPVVGNSEPVTSSDDLFCPAGPSAASRAVRGRATRKELSLAVLAQVRRLGLTLLFRVGARVVAWSGARGAQFGGRHPWSVTQLLKAGLGRSLIPT
jgi:hypothetical protein